MKVAADTLPYSLYAHSSHKRDVVGQLSVASQACEFFTVLGADFKSVPFENSKSIYFDQQLRNA